MQGGYICMAQVVDYSFSRPSPQSIAQAGYVGALRYLSGGGQKDLTVSELVALRAEGLSVGVVWETFANRASQGSAAGEADAVQANGQADHLGFGDDQPIYFAVDFQASVLSVSPYFDGVLTGSKRPVGIYGHYDLIEFFVGTGRIRYGWQCAAWSGTGAGTGGTIQNRRVSAHACLFQRVGYVLNNTADVDDVLAADWGQWPRPDGPAPTPTPQPSPGDDVQDVRFIRVDGDPAVYVTDGAGMNAHHVTSLQAQRYIIANSPNTNLLRPPGGAITDAPASPDVWVVKKGDWAP